MLPCDSLGFGSKMSSSSSSESTSQSACALFESPYSYMIGNAFNIGIKWGKKTQLYLIAMCGMFISLYELQPKNWKTGKFSVDLCQRSVSWWLTAIFLASRSALRFAAISFSRILFSIRASSSLKPNNGWQDPKNTPYHHLHHHGHLVKGLNVKCQIKNKRCQMKNVK